MDIPNDMPEPIAVMMVDRGYTPAEVRTVWDMSSVVLSGMAEAANDGAIAITLMEPHLGQVFQMLLFKRVEAIAVAMQGKIMADLAKRYSPEEIAEAKQRSDDLYAALGENGNAD